MLARIFFFFFFGSSLVPVLAKMFLGIPSGRPVLSSKLACRRLSNLPITSLAFEDRVSEDIYLCLVLVQRPHSGSECGEKPIGCVCVINQIYC